MVFGSSPRTKLPAWLRWVGRLAAVATTAVFVLWGWAVAGCGWQGLGTPECPRLLWYSPKFAVSGELDGDSSHVDARCRSLARALADRPCKSATSGECMEWSRCTAGLSVFVHHHDDVLSGQHVRPLLHELHLQARRAGVLSNTSSEACFEIWDANAWYGDMKLAWAGPSVSEIATALFLRVFEAPGPRRTGGGRNAVVVDLSDTPRAFMVPPASIGLQAALFMSHHLSCAYRLGHDLALPLIYLRSHFHPKSRVRAPSAASSSEKLLPPLPRRFLLTMRGGAHVGVAGHQRLALGRLHNGDDVVVLLKCTGVRGADLVSMADALTFREACAEQSRRWQSGAQRADWSYAALLNSTFALVPLGRSPASYRLNEVLAHGCIPVFFSDGFVRPLPDLVDWPRLSLTFPTNRVDAILPTLRAIPPAEVARMQTAVRELPSMTRRRRPGAFGTGSPAYFGTAEHTATAILRTLDDRVTFRG